MDENGFSKNRGRVASGTRKLTAIAILDHPHVAIARNFPADDVLPESTPVLIAEPVAWEVEYRCFALERQVLTSSVYLRYGELAQGQDGTWDAPDSEASEALELAGTVLRDPAVRFPAAAVLDVGRIVGRGWAVVESNAAWGSGIYGCDPALVLRVVQRACIKRNKLNEDDRAWVVERKPGRGS